LVALNLPILKQHWVVTPDPLNGGENSMQHTLRRLVATTASALMLTAAGSAAHAAPIFWTDWTGSDLDTSAGFKAQGTITTPTASVTVTYTNANGPAQRRQLEHRLYVLRRLHRLPPIDPLGPGSLLDHFLHFDLLPRRGSIPRVVRGSVCRVA
jgi:hypothetical protein